MSTTNELQYFDALRRITQYQSPDQLRRNSEREYGLDFNEALEYAYKNVIQEARNAVRGKRRPKVKNARDPQTARADADALSPEANNERMPTPESALH